MSKHHKPLVESPLFQTPLSKFINPKHELVLLAEKIDWNSLEVNVAGTMSTGVGRPMMKPRLMSGIFLLKHLYNLSDENVLRQFIENPYMQYFCGLTYFTHDFPCDSTTIVKWRKKLGPDFFEKVLEETVKLALRAKVLKPSDLKKIYVDTTVQEKNIQFPTDTRLYLKGIKVLNRIAGKAGVKPKQSYKFTGPKLALKYSRYAHAKQMKRAKKCGKSLKTCFGRLLRDLDRKFKSHDLVTDKVKKVFEISFRIFNQKKSDKNKIYSVHAPEVKCISKRKAHKKYEFGNKVSVATTVKKNFVVGALSFNSNLFDGKTLKESLEQASNIMGKNPEYAYVDRGYRGFTKDCG